MATTLAPPESRARLVALLAATALVALVIGLALGGWLLHHDGYISHQGDEFTAKVIAVKADSVCLARGSGASCAIPLYAADVEVSIGDTVRAVELEARDDSGAITSVYYIVRVK